MEKKRKEEERNRSVSCRKLNENYVVRSSVFVATEKKPPKEPGKYCNKPHKVRCIPSARRRTKKADASSMQCHAARMCVGFRVCSEKKYSAIFAYAGQIDNLVRDPVIWSPVVSRALSAFVRLTCTIRNFVRQTIAPNPQNSAFTALIAANHFSFFFSSWGALHACDRVSR